MIDAALVERVGQAFRSSGYYAPSRDQIARAVAFAQHNTWEDTTAQIHRTGFGGSPGGADAPNWRAGMEAYLANPGAGGVPAWVWLVVVLVVAVVVLGGKK